MADRLGELLVHRDLISLPQLQRAQSEQRAFGKRLTTILLKLGFISERQLAGFLAEHFKVPYFDFATHEIDPSVIRTVDKSIAVRHLAVPVQRAGSKLIVAMADPNNMLAIDDLKFHTNLNIDAVVSLEPAIEAAIARYYDKVDMAAPYGEVLGGLGLEPAVSLPERERPPPQLSEPEQSMAGRLCEAILRNALAKGASDIHIEPYEKGMRVRYRIDGALYHEMDPPLGYGASLIGKFKQQAGLDVGDRRQPLEGRLRFKAGKEREVAFHVVTLPTVFGEALRLRLLDRAALPADLARLGLDGEPLRQVRAALHRAHGLVLVAGLAGAGRSTTLCTALGELTADSVRIATVEDPVEYHLQGVSQVQVHPELGLGPAAAVRAVLRQDPDIVMVSELREFETAELCAKAAAGGRRVLAALPAGEAAAALIQLVHLGVEPHMIAAATSLVIAQRLVRRLCPECAEPDPSCSVQRLVDAGVPPVVARDGSPRRARGCKACHGGFRGRTAIFEVMPIGEALRERITDGAGVAELRAEAVRLGMRPLRLAGLLRVVDGTTSLDEVLRATTD
ncbi:GspE/PulE family protein [Nannocystis pusilla]|uniref:Flp pilus assembly complex ATPase component TadA n=1 Tax=Nannocystis pusilla TaxID=889268 RepID=A0ABS7TSI6_9BACT|nr:ATPase, T2SS/T4P/T4SS family [Nannocystis pusilla]MBZ5711194.1 Flp pilus assembly complex ATPase component TadA [Nannocystis pusilla]